MIDTRLTHIKVQLDVVKMRIASARDAEDWRIISEMIGACATLARRIEHEMRYPNGTT